MKNVIFLLPLLSLTVQAQTPSTSDRISRSDTSNTNISSSTASTNATSAGTATTSNSTTAAANLTFTNKEGRSYTVDQLANELKTLRASVEQAMPMLQAFNESYSNSATGDRSLTGRLSGLLSGALNRNQNTNTAEQSSGSGRYADLVGALQGVLARNNPNSPPISANTIRDLETLYGQLQPVNTTLQNLNVNIGSGTS